MVDALRKIKTLLKPNGLLVDIHPMDQVMPIYVQIGREIRPVGDIDVESKFTKYRQADKAIATVLQEGLFTVQRKTAVDFSVYFDTVAECRQYLAEEWSSAKLAEESWRQMTALMKLEVNFKQIFYSEGIKFCSLCPKGS
ncbi:MAG: hypothetical protein QNJ45_08470 [Ardenticatenaceae bacterium]|nr:hypothetical protein [Ardenticatenaceae bacterium]